MHKKYYQWQIQELEDKRPRKLIHASPRLGKTLYACTWLGENGSQRILVVAPKTVCPDWVPCLASIPALSGHQIVRGYKLSNLQLQKQLTGLEGPFIVVLNDDRLSANIAGILKWGLDTFVYDEVHRAKSVSSARGRAARRVAERVQFVRLLTGTLTSKNIGDLWGQLTMVDSNLWRKSFTQFAREHIVFDTYFTSKVLGARNPKKLQAMLNACSSSYKREEEFGADQYTESVVSIELSPRARVHYTRIVKNWVLEDKETGVDLEMPYLISRMTRLRQLCAGYLPGSIGKPTEIQAEKINQVLGDLDDILEAGQKVAIFCQFSWEVRKYTKWCKELCDNVYTISGDENSADKRSADIEEFNALDSAAIIIVQTASGGTGISLASANYAFFVSQGFDFAQEQQARERIYEPGKPKHITYYRVKSSIEEYIAMVLSKKLDVLHAVRNSRIEDIAFYEYERANEF